VDRPSALGRFATAPPRVTEPEMSAGPPYPPPHTPTAGPTSGRFAQPLAAGLGAGAVLAQICYPLLSGQPLRAATIVAVLLFAAASLTHATARFGPVAGGVRLLLTAGGIGLLAEAVGIATGVPFGSYRYSGTLGPAVIGVPLLVPLAWTMMAYPCLLLGRRLASTRTGHAGAARRAVTVLTGAATLAGWDLFLDPQMVAAGHWTWTFPAPALPGVPTVPLTNFAGWLVVATVMILVLHLALPIAPRPAAEPLGEQVGERLSEQLGERGGELVPAALLAWTWIGSAIGNVVFFDRPAVAGYGAVAMGVFTLPYLIEVFARRSISISTSAGGADSRGRGSR
jgi:uncharacterized membrane protein